MKRIVITRSNPVDPDSRVEKEANSLAKLGYRVTLLVWDRSADYKMRIDEKILNDSRVTRISIGAKAAYGAGFKSIKSYLKFQIGLFKWLICNRNKYDVCHFCDFDTAFIGSIAAKIVHKKFVFDIFDYLSTNADTLFKKVIKRLEDGIINTADATIICTEKRKEQIKDTRPKRLIVIHNTPDDIKFGDIKVQGKSSSLKVVYVGILQQKQRMLKELVDTISKMHDVELHIGGFGELEEYLKQAAKRYDNVYFYGKLAYKDTLALENQCDIVTAIYNPIIGNSLFAAPNKFYEALMLGKPLIMVKGTGMSEIVSQYDIGVLIDYTEAGLRQGLNEIILYRDKWNIINDEMKTLYKREYSWAEMENRLAILYEGM